MIFKEPVEEVSLDEVVISSGAVAVRADASTVLASPPRQDSNLPDFANNVKPPPPEDALINSGLVALTASGMLLEAVF
jgi:hypothetical protein